MNNLLFCRKNIEIFVSGMLTQAKGAAHSFIQSMTRRRRKKLKTILKFYKLFLNKIIPRDMNFSISSKTIQNIQKFSSLLPKSFNFCIFLRLPKFSIAKTIKFEVRLTWMMSGFQVSILGFRVSNLGF